MRATWAKRLLGVVIALAVIAVFAGLAYSLGASNGHGGAVMPMRPFGRQLVAGGYDWAGFGLLGLAGIVLLVLLSVWLIGALVSGPDRNLGRSVPPEAAGSVERLRELSDMHTAGQLTDEEFAAAKKQLLGL
jgi:hypothetical protein